ncbi:MAG: chemotaxis protein CheR [Rhodocyclaceae bacterium]|nr:chemotaxis protein CheR [Rhodocyclaceae bacterium]
MRRDFTYTGADFERITRLIYKRAGIALAASKRDMVYNRLSRRLRALSLTRFDDYLDRLEQDDLDPEWQHFVNALTTNTTSFFREGHHFPVLADLLRRCIGNHAPAIWCAAASTGEEPYSIAMTVADTLGPQASRVRIVASDLDTEVLEVAAAGVYPMERVERMDPRVLQRHFQKGRGAQSGNVRVRPELRRMIEFTQVNLLDTTLPVKGPFDAIFCRNVLIYFDRATQAQVVKRFAPLLRPDGLMFIGHSESLFHVSDIFRLQGQTIYSLVNRG